MMQLCINLDSRPDRWAQASAEFERVGLNVTRVSACTGENKPLAFNQSVYKAMLLADHSSVETNTCQLYYIAGDEGLLLFEDDVIFDGSFDLPTLIHHLPYGALSMHLGCNIMGQWGMPTAHDERVSKLHNCWQSHATYYSAECVAYILNKLSPEYIDENNCIFDEWFRRNILSLGRSYVLKPMIAYQRPSFSDIWNTQADYTQCHIDGNKYLASL